MKATEVVIETRECEYGFCATVAEGPNFAAGWRIEARTREAAYRTLRDDVRGGFGSPRRNTKIDFMHVEA